VRAIDRMPVLQKVADVLSVSVDELSGEDYQDPAGLTGRKHGRHCGSPSPATRQSAPRGQLANGQPQ